MWMIYTVACLLPPLRDFGINLQQHTCVTLASTYSSTHQLLGHQLIATYRNLPQLTATYSITAWA
eukprot:526156-Rhodomonas_salina.1